MKKNRGRKKGRLVGLTVHSQWVAHYYRLTFRARSRRCKKVSRTIDRSQHFTVKSQFKVRNGHGWIELVRTDLADSKTGKPIYVWVGDIDYPKFLTAGVKAV